MESSEGLSGAGQVGCLFDNALPIARYRFTALVQHPLELPDYAGSLLRGQFGAALRRVACMTRQPTCTACPLVQTCPYTRIFEAQPPPRGQHTLQDFSKIPNPYVMEPPAQGARLLAAGDVFEFSLVLLGQALDQLALVVFALQRALAQGLTRQRVHAQLLRVECLDTRGAPQTIWSHERAVLAGHNNRLRIPAVPEGLSGLTLNIHTPMRLQHQGRPVGVSQLSPRTLLAALARRGALLMELHAGQSGWGEAARKATSTSENLTDIKELHWFDWTRYSSRQQQEMTLGGVMGQWTLLGSPVVLAQVWPWLWLGQWLHAGKNTTMGMGAYTLESL